MLGGLLGQAGACCGQDADTLDFHITWVGVSFTSMGNKFTMSLSVPCGPFNLSFIFSLIVEMWVQRIISPLK